MFFSLDTIHFTPPHDIMSSTNSLVSMKRYVFIIFCCLIKITQLNAIIALQSDFFTLYNDGSSFSYGTNTDCKIDFQTEHFSIFNEISVITYDNLDIPFEYFTLRLDNLGIFYYDLGTSIHFKPIRVSADFFGAQMFDNHLSASIIDFNLSLKNCFGAKLDATLFDRFSFAGIFLTCSPEGFYSQKKFCEGKLYAAATKSEYLLKLDKLELDFFSSFAHAYGMFDFNFFLIDGFFSSHHIFGTGNAQASMISTGISTKTMNPHFNILCEIACAYLFTATLKATIQQDYSFLSKKNSTLSDYNADFSNTFLIPFTIGAKIQSHIFATNLSACIAKSFIIPVKFSADGEFSETTNNISADSIIKIILLSGINISVKIDL